MTANAADGHHRTGPERGAVLAETKHSLGPPRDDGRPHGQAAGQRLGDGDDVRARSKR